MYKAIPRKYLVHETEYHKYKGDDFEGESFEAPRLIEFVRVEPKQRLNRTANGDVVESNTIVFVDAEHSTPTDWVEKSKIVFRGREMRIITVAECFADSLDVHHWELFCL